MQKFAFEPDEYNHTQKKHYIYYDYCDRALKFSFQYSIAYGAGHLFFESKERAEECVSIIGEERIKKYYFGINN